MKKVEKDLEFLRNLQLDGKLKDNAMALLIDYFVNKTINHNGKKIK